MRIIFWLPDEHADTSLNLVHVYESVMIRIRTGINKANIPESHRCQL